MVILLRFLLDGRAAGLEGWTEPRRGVLYQDASHLIQASMDGQGVALVRRSLAMQDVVNGRLVRLFDIDAASPWAYWFICPQPLLETFRVQALRKWLHEETRQFQAMYARSPHAVGKAGKAGEVMRQAKKEHSREAPSQDTDQRIS